MSIKKIMLVKNSSVPNITLTCLRLLLKYHLCKQFGIPKCTVVKQTCSYNEA